MASMMPLDVLSEYTVYTCDPTCIGVGSACNTVIAIISQTTQQTRLADRGVVGQHAERVPRDAVCRLRQ